MTSKKRTVEAVADERAAQGVAEAHAGVPFADGIPVYCAFDELVGTDALIENPKNPNQHPASQVQALAKIIKNQGWRAPITVSARSGFITKGHGRLMAARLLGVTSVPVDMQEYDSEACEWADMIADNRIAELAEMDNSILSSLLVDLSKTSIDLDLTGFSEVDLSDMLATQPPSTSPNPDPGISPADEAQARLGVLIGDVWAIGPHRIACGDSGDPGVVKLLCRDGWAADCMVTDPPYGVDYSSKNLMLNQYQRGQRLQTPILNDAIDDYPVFFKKFLDCAPLAPINTSYIFGQHAERVADLVYAAVASGFHCSALLVWAKNNHSLGRSDYHGKHELILYCWRGKHAFYSSDHRTTLLEFARPKSCSLHPTMKPVPLLEQLINDGCPPGGNVYDAFVGSGSTIAAAALCGRVARGCELSPAYVAVSCERIAGIVGQTPTLVHRQGEDVNG